MARIFITGSSDGLGFTAAELLLQQGHQVVLHARNQQRAEETHRKLPDAEAVVTGDLASLRQTRELADQVNAIGRFDAVIHNAAVGYREPRRMQTEDGLVHVFAINSLAPYVLTGLIDTPGRLVYLSSGLHRAGDTSLRDPQWQERAWNAQQAYSDSKLHNVLLAFAAAARLANVCSNALEPGWVGTKMGGPGATDDLRQGHLTQAWLAASDDAAAQTSGGYFYHLQRRDPLPQTRSKDLQDEFVALCAGLSGVRL